MGKFSIKLTTEEFISKSNKVHGNKYDYSLVEYTGSKNKVVIVCPKHGEFTQQAGSHMKGIGCPKCGISRVKEKISLSHEEFISRCKEVHGDVYDYSRSIYINNRTKVVIVCPKHGEFTQQAGSHMKGIGCPVCSGMKKLTTEEFISKANKVHGNKYDYSLVEYINNHTKVKIICPIHDEFNQTPNAHISQKQGCYHCGITTTRDKNISYTEEFISKANKVHGNKYDYSLVEYVNAYTKIKIICPYHGMFSQIPYNHLSNHGCSICKSEKASCENRTTSEEFINRLTIEEEPIEVDGEIQCKCTFCKKYFIPTRQQIKNRIYSLSGKQKGEQRLYCSDTCKNLCPIFGQSKYYKNQDKPNTPRPEQGPLREIVLTRDNFTCQRCGSSEDLHCHHITGVEINPVESADIDNCITLCYTCHSRIHSQPECSMHRKPCKTEII